MQRRSSFVQPDKFTWKIILVKGTLFLPVPTSNRISLPFTCVRERPLSGTVVYYSCPERLLEMRPIEYHTTYRTWVCLFLCVLRSKICAEWRTLGDLGGLCTNITWRCFTKTSHQHTSPAYIKWTIRAALWSWLSWLYEGTCTIMLDISCYWVLFMKIHRNVQEKNYSFYICS